MTTCSSTSRANRHTLRHFESEESALQALYDPLIIRYQERSDSRLPRRDRSLKKKEKAAQKEAAKKEREAKKAEREAKKEVTKREKQSKKDKRLTQLSATMPDSIPPTLLYHEAASLFNGLFKDNSPLKFEEIPDANAPEKELSNAEPIKEEQENDNGNPDTNEPFNNNLIKLRTYIDWIDWGKKWYALSEQKTVA